VSEERGREEALLARVLGAARAEADPEVLARARARIAEVGEVPSPLRWLGTPAALATAITLFVVVAGLSLALTRNDTSSGRESTSLVSALIGDDGSYGLPSSSAARASDSVTLDSGEVAR